MESGVVRAYHVHGRAGLGHFQQIAERHAESLGDAHGDGPVERREPVQVPAFVAEESATRDQARTLVLDTDSADRVELTLPETGVCGGAGLFDVSAADRGDDGCCAPTPQLVQLGATAPAEEASTGGCCGS